MDEAKLLPLFQKKKKNFGQKEIVAVKDSFIQFGCSVGVAPHILSIAAESGVKA
jgi:hypothetical protein